MQKSSHEMLESAEFKSLVAKRGTVSVVLLVLLFITYYGFILLVGFNKPYLAQKLSATGVTTLGIPLGVGVIIAAWVLTTAYVIWANNTYDPEVRRLRALLLGK